MARSSTRAQILRLTARLMTWRRSVVVRQLTLVLATSPCRTLLLLPTWAWTLALPLRMHREVTLSLTLQQLHNHLQISTTGCIP